ncbi:putative integral membrane protein [Neofusicoccum parvum]|nr:putative integral membrane protein [Neofusicoccum parvum]
MPGGIHPPIELLKAWKTDNVTYPKGERKGPSLMIGIIVMYIVTLVIVLGRLWARIVVQRNQGIDDYLIIATILPTTGLAIALALAGPEYGFDRHTWELTPELAVQSRQLAMAASSLYIISTGLTKISILCFYRRLGSGTISKWYLMAVKASIIFVIAYMITFNLTLFFGCNPIKAYWMQVDFMWYMANKSKMHCMDEGADYLAASVISVVQDFLACCLPIMIMWTLQIPKRQKLALGGVFGIGLFLCLIGILRIHQIKVIYYDTYDLTWAAHDGWAWTAVEAHVAIICASAPALKLFFRRVLQATGYGSGSRVTGGYFRSGTHGHTGGRSAHGRSHQCKDDCTEDHSNKLSPMHTKKGGGAHSHVSARSGSSSTTDEEIEIQSPSHMQREFHQQMNKNATAEAKAYSVAQAGKQQQPRQHSSGGDFGIHITNEVDVSVSKSQSAASKKSSRESLL